MLAHLDGLNCTTANEIEYLAEDQIITVIPNFTGDPFIFMNGRTDKFRPARPAKVPLWFGMLLKKRGQCRVQMPAWFSKGKRLPHQHNLTLGVDSLEERLQEERSSEFAFAEMPDFYQETAAMLFEG